MQVLRKYYTAVSNRFGRQLSEVQFVCMRFREHKVSTINFSYFT